MKDIERHCTALPKMGQTRLANTTFLMVDHGRFWDLRRPKRTHFRNLRLALSMGLRVESVVEPVVERRVGLGVQKSGDECGHRKIVAFQVMSYNMQLDSAEATLQTISALGSQNTYSAGSSILYNFVMHTRVT